MSLKDIGPKLITITENEQKVFEAGKTAEWNAFWDAMQSDGTRTVYTSNHNSGFGRGWDDTTFKPKYDIKPVGTGGGAFYYSRIKDLKSCLAFNNVKIDLSQCTSCYQFFAYAALTTVGEIDMSVMTSGNASGFFQGCMNLVTVDLFRLSDKVWFDTYSFQNNVVLVDIRFDGFIWASLNMSPCSKLSIESMKDIISHLKDYAGTDKEFTYTLSFHANRWKALEADSTAPDGGTWQDYVGSLGWNT